MSSNRGGVTRETSAALVLDYFLGIGAVETAELFDSKLPEPEHGTKPLQTLKAYTRPAGDDGDDESSRSTLSYLVERALHPGTKKKASPATLHSDAWTASEIAALRFAVKQYPASLGRKTRFASVASHVGTKSIRQCFDKFTELRDAKVAKAAAATAASSEDVLPIDSVEGAFDGDLGGDQRASTLPSAHAEPAVSAKMPATAPSIWDALISDANDDVTAARLELPLAPQRRAAVEKSADSASHPPVLSVADDAFDVEELVTIEASTRPSGASSGLLGPPDERGHQTTKVSVSVGGRQCNAWGSTESGGGGAGSGAPLHLESTEFVIDDVGDDDTPAPSSTWGAGRGVVGVAAGGGWGRTTSKQMQHTQGFSGFEDIDAAVGKPRGYDDSPAGQSRESAPSVSFSLDKGAVRAAAEAALGLGARGPTLIKADAAAALRLLLYGEARSAKPGNSVAVRSFNSEWLGQGIIFSDLPGMQYGLLQPRGGPCGALASLQAEVLRYLFYGSPGLYDGSCAADVLAEMGCGKAGADLSFEPEDSAVTPLDPSQAQQQRALVLAFTDIIWRCRDLEVNQHAVVAVVDESTATTRERIGVGGRFGAASQLRVGETSVLYSPDGITERLLLWHCPSKAAVAAVVEANLPVLARSSGPGLALLVYSAMLTRGLQDVVSDMDTGMGGAATLIGAHNYATQVTNSFRSTALFQVNIASCFVLQELVNLLLVGRAHSNVFDGTEVVPGSCGDGSDNLLLRGIPVRACVGFVSLFESLGYIKVGDHFKCPAVPIWVVSSESHYSVIFAAPRGAVWPSDCYEKSRTAAAKRRLGYIEPSDALSVGLGALRHVGNASAGLPLDLIYFDGLGHQEAICRLTASLPSRCHDATPAVDDDPPPLEAVVRTLWPGASVIWNGTDPIL